MKKNLLNLNTNNKEKYLLKDGEFFIERASQQDFLFEKNFLLESGVKANYLLIVDKEIDEPMSRDWILNDHSQLKSYRLFLKGRNSHKLAFRHNINEAARIDSRSLVLAINEEKLNLESIYNFSGYSSFGRVKVDALLAGKAELKFHSDINVLPSAQKSDTRVDMTLKLENDGVRGEIIPGLNIAANDVKAGHSAGTFRLKTEDLFYLRSRGLNKVEIRDLFVSYLSKSFVAGIKDNKLKEELIQLIYNSL